MKPTPRRWFQYSLRTFLVLMTALAVWLGVVVNRAREQREAVEAIEALGGAVTYDWELEPNRKEPPGPGWLRTLIGDDFFQEVHEVALLSDFHSDVQPDSHIRSAIPQLKRLPQLKKLWYSVYASDDTNREITTALPNSELHAVGVGIY